MGKTILFGEPMALLIADTTGPLENVEHFTRALSGAEVNVSIGLTRLGHSVEYLTRLGDDPFGHYIAKTLGENQIGISLLSYDPVYRTGIQLKNRVTDGSDPYAPYYRKGSAASHISEKEIDAIDLTDVNLVHITGIPCARDSSNTKGHLSSFEGRIKIEASEILVQGFSCQLVHDIFSEIFKFRACCFREDKREPSPIIFNKNSLSNLDNEFKR